MFDLFGMNKTDAHDAIKNAMHGVTLGILDGYEWRLREKEDTINRQLEKIAKLEEEKAELQAQLEKFKESAQ